jgi:cytochrome P450
MDQSLATGTEAPVGSMLTVLSDDIQRAIWGDDAPEHWLRLGREAPRRSEGIVWLTSTGSVHEAMQQSGVFSSAPSPRLSFGTDEALIPLQVDPPEHVRFRRMLDPLFAPKKVAVLEQDLTVFANQCIDKFAEEGRCDFSEQFAVPFPIGTFLRLLGLPYEGLENFLRLKDGQIRPPGATAEEREITRLSTRAEIVRIFDAALNERSETPREDILSYFRGLEKEGRLTRDQVLNICHLLLLAGLDTVTGTLEVAFGLLARRPDLQSELANDTQLVPGAVEELLRWVVTSPTQFRVATKDTEIEGFAIRRGDPVAVLIATENFDPERFDSPTDVNLRRQPNSHVAFSEGVHRCLGSHLARLELAIALREWHRRIPQYHLADGFGITYTPALRGIPHLSLQFP